MTERPYWIAAGTVGWGAIVLWQAAKLPQFDQYAHIGPGFMPSMVGLGLVVLGIILALQIRAGVSFEEQGAEEGGGQEGGAGAVHKAAGAADRGIRKVFRS